MKLCDDKCIVNTGAPGFLLALSPRTKAGRVTEEVETQSSDHTPDPKTHIRPAVIFNIVIQTNSILIVSAKDRKMLELKIAPFVLNLL